MKHVSPDIFARIRRRAKTVSTRPSALSNRQLLAAREAEAAAPVPSSEQPHEAGLQRCLAAGDRVPVGLGRQVESFGDLSLGAAELEEGIGSAEPGAEARLLPAAHRQWELEEVAQDVVDVDCAGLE